MHGADTLGIQELSYFTMKAGRLTRFLAAGWLAVILSACGGDSDSPTTPTPPAPTVASVTVTPASVLDLQVTDTAQFTAEVRDTNGGVMTGQTIAWSSSNDQVATVSTTGLVTITGGGSATITATVGTRSGQASVSAHPWKVADNAVVVDSTILSLQSDSTERANGTYRFQVAPGQSAPTIEPGDVIVGAQAGGFLRRVEAVSVAGGVITANTVGGALVDVVKEGAFDVSVPLSLNGPAAVAGLGSAENIQWGPAEVIYMSPLVQQSSGGFSLTGSLCDKIKGFVCPATIKKLEILGGELAFDPDRTNGHC